MAGGPRMLVVGAGPAGLSAAAQGRRLGLEVTVVDEGTTLGGQYFRGRQDSTDEAAPRRLEGDLQGAAIALVTSVIDAPREGLLSTWHPERGIEDVAYDWIVVATGAHDRTVPIPGWTLPGVLTAGGAHTLAKSHHVTPGKRMLVAGSGPFILAVADVLAGAGCDVTTVEATGLRAQLAALPILARDPVLLRQAAGYMARLALRRSTPRYGWSVKEIVGSSRVEAAVIHRVDGQWRPVPGTEETVAFDGVCLGFGFVPRLDLAVLLGCEIHYDAHSSDYRVAVDDAMRTSLEYAYAAGEVTGIAGVRVAHLEGRLAALSIAFAAGRIDRRAHSRIHGEILDRLRQRRRAARWMQEAYRPRPALWSLAAPATTICRCEDVDFGAVAAALESTAAHPLAVKAATRIGMGLCQGRICSPALIEWLRASHGYDPPATGRPWSVRPPMSPVPVRDLARYPERTRSSSSAAADAVHRV